MALLCTLGVFLLARPEALSASSLSTESWTRNPSPGVEYRMIVEKSPARIIHALRIDPSAGWDSQSSLAGDEVYDLTPSNGRRTVSQMVASSGALGGINGDFFQWGDDPGGDPLGLMVRNGELISHPGTKGDRAYSIGWNSTSVPTLLPKSAKAEWTATAGIGTRKFPIRELNAYTATTGVTLSTPSAGYAISKSPAIFVVLKTGPQTLSPQCAFDGTVSHSFSEVEKLNVMPGTVVLSAQASAPMNALKNLKKGDRVRIEIAVKGYDWSRTDNVIGGGPLLIEDGAILPSKDEVRHPRSAIGVDANGGTWYVVIDGRQEMSVGATIPETAEIMLALGCREAINLDGGGSSTLNLFGTVINRPSGGIERTVANGILWFGQRSGQEGISAKIEVAGELRQGTNVKLTLRGQDGREINHDQVIWTAQGSGWIQQDGRVHLMKEGPISVRAIFGGRTFEANLNVKP